MPEPIDYDDLDRGRHCNYWTYDRAIREELRARCDAAELDWGEPHLREFGELVGDTVVDNADTAADHPPELHNFDADGERIDEIEHHPAHLENERLVYESGLIADAFEAPPDRGEPASFLYHFGQFYLLEYASSVGLSCPGAMTGGAALVLEKFDDGTLSEFYDGLTARDYDDLRTGAMFLTEKQGGSDVGLNEVRAEPTDEEDVYELHGEKWFCSNADTSAALVLARRPGAPDGTEGLSLFVLSDERRDGQPNDYRIRRLKDKLGTTTVPTGEIELDGAEAFLLGEPENGFKMMSEMLNMERLYNAIGACGGMARALLESKVHAADREVFGDRLDEQPLMRRDLVEMAVDHEAALAFTFEAVAAFDRHERDDGDADDAYRLMRMLVPVTKYRTARMTVDTTTYAMEIKGGNGYVEDVVHPRLVRNAHVSPIWEGASNIVSLDVLRAMATEAAHEPTLDLLDERLDAVEHPALTPLAETVREERERLAAVFASLATDDEADAQHRAKDVADYVFDVTTAAVLLERAQRHLDGDGDARKALVAEAFVDRHLSTDEARGIADDGAIADPVFDAVVRYGSADPSLLDTGADTDAAADAPAQDD